MKKQNQKNKIIFKFKSNYLLSCAIALSCSSGTSFSAYAESSFVMEEVTVTARYREESLQQTPLPITAVSGERLESQSLQNVQDLGLAIPNASIRQSGASQGPSAEIGLRGVTQNDFTYAFEPGVGVYVDDVYHGSLMGSTMDLMDLERVEVLRGPQGTLFGKNSLGGAIRLISKKPEGDGSGYFDLTYGTSHRLDFKGGADLSLIENKLFMRVNGVSKKIDGYVDRLDFVCQMNANGTPELAGTLPSTLPGNVGCKTGENGGQDLQAGRVMLRYLASDELEMTLAADYSKQIQGASPEVLVSSHSPTSFVNALYNNAVIEPTFGIRFDDDRFLTGDHFTTYDSFTDPLNGTRYPDTQETNAWNLSGTVEYDINDSMHMKFIGAYRTYDSTWALDQDHTPLDLFTVLNILDYEQYTAELLFSGTALNNRLEWTAGAYYFDSSSTINGLVDIALFEFPGFLPAFMQNDGFDNSSESVFLHGVYDLTDKLSVTAGVRFTTEDKEYSFDHPPLLVIDKPLEYGDDQISWMLGMDYQLDDSTLVYGLISTGFRSSGAQPRPGTVGQLRPISGEELTNYELGLKTDLLDNTLRVNASVFYNDYNPRISLQAGVQCNAADNPDPGTRYPLNSICPVGTELAGVPGLTWNDYVSAPGTAHGAELEVIYNPVGNLVINGSLGYYDYSGDEDDSTSPLYWDDSVRSQARYNGSLGVQYPLQMASGTLTPRLDWFYQGERTNGSANVQQLDPENIIPSYDLTNARLTYETADGSWSTSLAVTNLFDEFYWVQIGAGVEASGAPADARTGLPGRGREWTLGMRYNF